MPETKVTTIRSRRFLAAPFRGRVVVGRLGRALERGRDPSGIDTVAGHEVFPGRRGAFGGDREVGLLGAARCRSSR